MRFILWSQWEHPYFNLSIHPLGYFLLSLYAGAWAFVFSRRWKEWRHWEGKEWLLLLALTLSAVAGANVFLVRIPGSRGVSYELPLLSTLPVLTAAWVLGVTPASVVALAGGLSFGLFNSHRLLQGPEGAFFGLLLGFLIRQKYRGSLFSFLRQPVVATPLSCLVWWPIPFYAYIALADPLCPLMAILEGLIGGLFLQVLFHLNPSWRPDLQEQQVPPYARSLNLRFSFLLVPLTLAVVLVLFYAVEMIAFQVMLRQAKEHLAIGVDEATFSTTLFFQMGHEVITAWGHDRSLAEGDFSSRQEALRRIVETSSFFDQGMVLDGEGRVVMAHPSLEGELNEEEKALVRVALETGRAFYSRAYRLPQGDVALSFATPLYGQEGMVLLARTRLRRNPILRAILAELQGTMTIGFILDEEHRIVLHPEEALSFSARELRGEPGVVFQEVDEQGKEWLVYYRLVEGYPWIVMAVMPVEVIPALASRISIPLLALLSVLGVLIAASIPWVTSQLSRPLSTLAQAASRIARGHLETPIEIVGEDEVGRLGLAFERMRLSLKKQMEDSALLLSISQAVSRSLDLKTSLVSVLQGVKRGTGATIACAILLDAQGQILELLTDKGPWEGKRGPLDPVSRRVVRERAPILIENVRRDGRALSAPLQRARVQAAACFPLLSGEEVIGLLWAGYSAPRSFGEVEKGLLSALATQAVIAVERARLFSEVESERRRLSAILSSATDVILAVDDGGCLQMANPAAEAALGIELRDKRGQNLLHLLPPELEEFVRGLIVGKETHSTEVKMPDGKAFYVSASPITTEQGKPGGWLLVMRDISQVKKLDEMKSEFISTVSHDLRGPLTFVRGYASMLPMVGTLNARQKEFVRKIIQGIDQMTELVNDLLDLGKIEAGVDIEMAPCQVEQVVKAVVGSLQDEAEAKGLKLLTRWPSSISTITADKLLLRQAVFNLVDNAIKYTPSGYVSVEIEETEEEVIIVVRDTGIGISSADLPRIFERFYRVRRPETLHINGTGLGLTIVRSIAQRHNGRVWVESRLGEGSTFYLALPKNRERGK